MSNRFRAAVFLALLACWGCASIPFREVSPVPEAAGVEPAGVRGRFESDLASRYQVIGTIVFRYGWRSFSAIGYTAVDSDKKSFTVVGLTPIGIKLFELTGDASKVETRFAMEEFTRKGKFAETVAGDIRRIYFDRVPEAGASARKETDRIVFTQPEDDGTLTFVFAGADNNLVEKRFSVDNEKEWAVFYYEWVRREGKLYPSGIILKNYRYGYRLTIRGKEIRDYE